MHILRRIVFCGLLVLIALAPLPFGCNRPWAWSLLSLWVGGLVLLDAVAAGFTPERGETSFMRRISVPFILFLAVVVWIALQTTQDIYTELTHPIWLEVRAQLGQLLPSYVTVSPERTRDALMVLLAYAGVFWLAARYGRHRKNAALMLKFFVIVSSCYAIYGLAVYFGGWEKILWYDKTSYRGDLTSTFVNRNSYATYAAMGLIASVVMLVSVFAHDLRQGRHGREMLRRMTDGALKKACLPVLGTLTTGTALMLTHSRAGFSSGMIGILAVLIGLFVARILPRKTAGWSVVGLLCLLVAGFWFSGDVLEQRFERADADQDIRFAVYGQVMEGIQVSPVTGYGYGAFETGFRQFKQQNTAWATWDLAHNSYLEFAFGAGVVPLLVCLGLFAIIFAKNAYSIVLRRRDQIYPIAGVASCLTVAAHSLVDFSVQMPAMGAGFMFLVALGWGQSWSGQSEKQQRYSSVQP